MMKHSSSLLCLPTAAMAAGIIAGKMGAGLITGGLMIAVAIVCYFLVSKSALEPVRGFALNRWHYAWIFFLFAGVGMIDYSLSTPEDFGKELNNICFVEGRVVDKSVTTSGDRVTIEIERGWDSVANRMIRTPGLKIIATSQGNGPDVDDLVRIKNRLFPITDNENYFSGGYSARLRNSGILYRSNFEPENLLITGHKTTLRGKALKIREKIETVIENCGLSTNTSHFLISILLGDLAFLHDDLRQLFADGGVSHMLALSGMHIGIIAGIVLWILVPFNIIGRFKLRLGLTLVIILIYTFLTGMAPSTTRASLMLGGLTIGVLIERKNNALNALFFSSLIILLVTPSALYDIGFQLSFMCVFALIIFADRLNPVDHRRHRIWYRLFGMICACFVATLATWIVTAYYFGQIPLSFLGANLVFLPLLPIYILLAIIYICFAACGVKIHILGELLDISLQGSMNFLEWLTGGGKTTIEFHPSEISVALWILFLCFLGIMFIYKKKKLWGGISLSCLGLFILSLFITPGYEVKNGLILQRSARDLRVLVRNNGLDQTIKFKRHTISEFNHNGDWFLTIDTPTDSIQTFPNRRYKAVIIAGNFKSEIGKTLEKISTELVITHPTLRQQWEKEILHCVDSLSIPRHSIREAGAWRLIQSVK